MMILPALVVVANVVNPALYCVLDAASSIRAEYDVTSKKVAVEMVNHGRVSQMPGVSFSKASASKIKNDLVMVQLAERLDLDLAKVKSANIFIVSQNSERVTALVEYLDLSGKSLASGAVIDNSLVRCY